MRRITIALAATMLCATSPLFAQDAPPATDVYLSTIERAEGGWTIGTPSNLTARPGYDNQPAFTPEGDGLVYTSYRDGQADVWRLALPAGSAEPVTRTPESEYSPTPAPDGSLSVVRVEADSTQRLWRFTGEGEAVEPLLTDVAPVGYHAWLDSVRVVLYVLGDPPELKVADLAAGVVRAVASGIGRSLQAIPGGGVSFVRIEDDDDREAWLHRLAPDGRTTERLARMPDDRVDHAWGPDGTVWVAVDGDLWAWHPERDGGRGFSRVASLSEQGLVGITRIAVSPDGDRIAMVAEDPRDRR